MLREWGRLRLGCEHGFGVDLRWQDSWFGMIQFGGWWITIRIEGWTRLTVMC